MFAFSNRLTVGLLSVLFLLLFAPMAEAQNAAGIGLKPSLIEDAADPGEIKDYTIEVKNLSGTENIYYLFPRDIVGVQDGGSPIFAKDETEITGYEMSTWLQLGQSEVTLAPGKSATIPVQVKIPEDATPGSHFSGIFVSLEPPKMRESGVGVGFDVGNIVSIRVSGDVNENALIRSFTTGRPIYGSTNVDFLANIENKGNVLVRPTGPLEVYNMFNEKVANLTFNENEGGVFPGVTREFLLNWSDDRVGFGRYKAILSLSYGAPGSRATISSTLYFWVLPAKIIWPALIVLAILLLSVYVSVKMYVRNQVNGLGATRRVMVRRGGSASNPTLMLVMVVMLSVTALFLIVLLMLFA